MKKTGTLTIDDGESRLDGTRLMKGAVNAGGFGRATTFLRQDRGLNDQERIWVNGVDDFFGEMPVIVITNAGPVAMMAALNASKAAGAGKAAKKSAAKKSAAKKSGAQKSGSGKGKAAAKKSTGKVSGK